MQIEIIVTDDRVNVPAFQTAGAAGLDLQAVLEAPLTLQPDEVKLIGTGIKLNINDPSVMAVLAPRSSVGHKRGLNLGNTIGIIDSDYQGELMLSMWNRSTVEQTITPFERIAQVMFVPVLRPELKVVESFVVSERGEGGFGSTGTK